LSAVVIRVILQFRYKIAFTDFDNPTFLGETWPNLWKIWKTRLVREMPRVCNLTKDSEAWVGELANS